jgi:glycerol dehydrogenase
MEPRMDMRVSYFPGKCLQGNGIIKDLPTYIDLFGGDAFLVVTPSMEKLVRSLGLADKHKMVVFRGPCCWQEVDKLIATAKEGNHTVVVAIGGGKVVDSAKVVADKLNLRCIMVPSVAASSAAFSGCSVMYTPDNVEEGVYYEKHSPDVLMLDNEIIIGAKTRYFVAGMGDALAVYFEGRGCNKTGSQNSLHANQTFCALAMCEYCYDALLRYGLAAKLAYDKKVVTPALERMIEVNLLSAGIAFEGAGLAAAHAIHNGLTLIPSVRNDMLHGEIVAFGVLSELHLTNAEPEEMAEVYDFCEKVGLPTTFADLGIADVDRETLMEVAEFTYNDPYLHHDGPNITAKDIMFAMVAADAMGQARKNK